MQGRLGRYRISGEIRRLRSQNCVNNTVLKQLYVGISELLRSWGFQIYLICSFKHFWQDLPKSWKNSNFDQFLAISGQTLLKFAGSTNKNTICQAQICFQEILSFRLHYCTLIFINFEGKFKIRQNSQFSWLMGVVEAPSPSGIPNAPSNAEVVRSAVLSKKRKSHLYSHAVRIRPKQTRYKF